MIRIRCRVRGWRRTLASDRCTDRPVCYGETRVHFRSRTETDGKSVITKVSPARPAFAGRMA